MTAKRLEKKTFTPLSRVELSPELVDSLGTCAGLLDIREGLEYLHGGLDLAEILSDNPKVVQQLKKCKRHLKAAEQRLSRAAKLCS